MFHTSDCKKFKRCQKYFWLSKKEPTPPFSPYVRMDEDLTALACQKLGIKEYFQGVRGDDPQRAMAALEESEWLVSARFEFHQLRVKFHFSTKQMPAGKSIFCMAAICLKKTKHSVIC